MTRLRTVGRDLRALGAGAPLRAAYEGSKRLGGHAAAFGALARRPPATAASRPVYDLPEPPEQAVERVRDAADDIAGGVVVVFGRPVEVGDRPDWHRSFDPAAPDLRWPDEPWWRLDLRSAARIADVKWTWELARHRHLVLLARAVASPSPDPRWAATLHGHLESWMDQNPPERGVHWYSNLEVALRAMAWLEVLQRAGDHLDPAIRRSMDQHLHHAGSHLLLDLPYTLSTMRNNHLLGDAAGLVVLSKAFPDDPASRAWQRAGSHLLARQVEREVRPDGSMIEDSVSYHRFVIELLARRVLVGDPPTAVTAALHRSARFLARLGVLDGPVPQYGDWDGGRALASCADQADLAGSTVLGLSLAGGGAPAAWRDEYDEVAWYAREARAGAHDVARAEAAQADGHDLGGAIGRAERDPFAAWLKAGGGPWHGHADHGSVAVRHDGAWVIGDPGTGNYNGPDAGRTFLRSSEAHSVLQLEGEDQLVPHRAFRWVHQATGRIGPPVALPGAQVMWCAHDAYTRLTPRRRVARVVVVSEGGVVVADWVEGPPGASWQLALPMAPGATWDRDVVTTPAGTSLHLRFLNEPVERAAQPGPWSETYGAVEPSTRLVAHGSLGGPVAWDLRGGDAIPAALHGDVLRYDDASINVSWLAGAVELVVHHPELPPAPPVSLVL